MDTERFGNRGNGVLLLQLALRREGSYKDEPDGVFGTRTLNALRRFQSSHGLKPDGIAGERTFRAAKPYLYGYIEYRLRPGDSFYRLSKRFPAEAEAIAAANPALDPAELPIGAAAVIPVGRRIVPTDIPYSSELLEILAEGIGKRYPFISVTKIGSSVLGKPIWAFTMGRGKREVFINSAHHANEWITAPLLLDFLESWALAYSSHGTIVGRSAAELYSRCRLFAVPMVDPDGVDLVNGAVSREGFARALDIAEEFPDVPFPSGWKANIEGIDLNLSYPYNWEEAKRIKFAQGWSRPAPRDYVGKEPLEALEARAVWEFAKAHEFDAALSYHTQGGEIYWRLGSEAPEGAPGLAEKMARASGYELAEVPKASANAGFRDWFIAEYGRPGFTVEAGRGVNPLPLSQYDRLREDNFPLMASFMEG